MKITAITRFKQGELWAALKRVEWTQAELARRTDLKYHLICDIVNVKRRPTEEQADKIQRVFGEEDIFLDVLTMWPPEFKGFGKSVIVEQTEEIPMDHLLEYYEMKQLNPAVAIDRDDAISVLYTELEKLTPQQQHVIDMRMSGATLAEVGDKWNTGKERIRQIEAKAMRILRGGERRGRQLKSEHLLAFDPKGAPHC